MAERSRNPKSPRRHLGHFGAIRTTMISWSGWGSKEIVGNCPPSVLSNPCIRCGFGGKIKNRMMSTNTGYLDAKARSVNFCLHRIRGHSVDMGALPLNTPLTLRRLETSFHPRFYRALTAATIDSETSAVTSLRSKSRRCVAVSFRMDDIKGRYRNLRRAS
jgi:hypothetical protein